MLATLIAASVIMAGIIGYLAGYAKSQRDMEPAIEETSAAAADALAMMEGMCNRIEELAAENDPADWWKA